MAKYFDQLSTHMSPLAFAGMMNFQYHKYCLLLRNLEKVHCTKNEFSVTDFLSKCEQIRSFLQICPSVPKELLTENLIFCAVADGQEEDKKEGKQQSQSFFLFISKRILQRQTLSVK